MRLLIKMLMRNQFNILHLEKKLLKKKFSKLSLPKTFRVTHGYLTLNNLGTYRAQQLIIIHKIFFQKLRITYIPTYVFSWWNEPGHMPNCTGLLIHMPISYVDKNYPTRWEYLARAIGPTAPLLLNLHMKASYLWYCSWQEKKEAKKKSSITLKKFHKMNKI